MKSKKDFLMMMMMLPYWIFVIGMLMGGLLMYNNRPEITQVKTIILPVTVTPWNVPTQTARVRVYVIGPTLEPAVTLKNGSVDGGGIYSPKDPDSYAPSPTQYLVCFNAEVRGGPAEFYQVLRSVKKGELVEVREFSRPDRTWVMIGLAEWLPWSALCH